MILSPRRLIEWTRLDEDNDEDSELIKTCGYHVYIICYPTGNIDVVFLLMEIGTIVIIISFTTYYHKQAFIILSFSILDIYTYMILLLTTSRFPPKKRKENWHQ